MDQTGNDDMAGLAGHADACRYCRAGAPQGADAALACLPWNRRACRAAPAKTASGRSGLRPAAGPAGNAVWFCVLAHAGGTARGRRARSPCSALGGSASRAAGHARLAWGPALGRGSPACRVGPGGSCAACGRRPVPGPPFLPNWPGCRRRNWCAGKAEQVQILTCMPPRAWSSRRYSAGPGGRAVALASGAPVCRP